MRASKGGLTHSEIMSLTWRQFWTYVDSFSYLIQEESEEGRRKNQKWDLKAMLGNPMVKEWKRKLIETAKQHIKRV